MESTAAASTTAQAVERPLTFISIASDGPEAETAGNRFLNAVFSSRNTFNGLARHLRKDRDHTPDITVYPEELGVSLSFSEQVLKDGNSAFSAIRDRYFDLMNEVNPAQFATQQSIKPQFVLQQLEQAIADVDRAEDEIRKELNRAILIMENIKTDHRAFIETEKTFMEGLMVGAGVGIQDIPWASRKRNRHWGRAEDEGRVRERGDRYYA